MAPIVSAAIAYNLFSAVTTYMFANISVHAVSALYCFEGTIVLIVFSISISLFLDAKLFAGDHISWHYVFLLTSIFTILGVPTFWILARGQFDALDLGALGGTLISGMTGYGVWSALHLCIRSAERAIAQERKAAALREAMLKYENEALSCTLDSGFFIEALSRVGRALKDETGVLAGEIVMSLAERMRTALAPRDPSAENVIEEAFAEPMGRTDGREISDERLRRLLLIGWLGVWVVFFSFLFLADIAHGIVWWKALSDYGVQSIVGLLWFAVADRILRKVANFRMQMLSVAVYGICVLGAFACGLSYYLSCVFRGDLSWPPLVGYVVGFEFYYVAPIFIGWGAIHVLVEARRRETARLSAAAEIREAALNARNAMLRLQLNPHFLFNTLNALYVLILDRQFERARGMIAAVRRFLDRAGDPAADEFVALSSELATQDAYLEIERVRFGDRLRVDRCIDAEVAAMKVPHLILQPLVENAVKYAVARTDRPVAVEIRARRTGRELVLTVADTGAPEAAPRPPGLGVGLRNVEARLKSLYGEAGRLACRRLEPAGFLAEVRLPLSL